MCKIMYHLFLMIAKCLQHSRHACCSIVKNPIFREILVLVIIYINNKKGFAGVVLPKFTRINNHHHQY